MEAEEWPPGLREALLGELSSSPGLVEETESLLPELTQQLAGAFDDSVNKDTGIQNPNPLQLLLDPPALTARPRLSDRGAARVVSVARWLISLDSQTAVETAGALLHWLQTANVAAGIETANALVELVSNLPAQSRSATGASANISLAAFLLEFADTAFDDSSVPTNLKTLVAARLLAPYWAHVPVRTNLATGQHDGLASLICYGLQLCMELASLGALTHGAVASVSSGAATFDNGQALFRQYSPLSLIEHVLSCEGQVFTGLLGLLEMAAALCHSDASEDGLSPVSDNLFGTDAGASDIAFSDEEAWLADLFEEDLSFRSFEHEHESATMHLFGTQDSTWSHVIQLVADILIDHRWVWVGQSEQLRPNHFNQAVEALCSLDSQPGTPPNSPANSVLQVVNALFDAATTEVQCYLLQTLLHAVLQRRCTSVEVIRLVLRLAATKSASDHVDYVAKMMWQDYFTFVGNAFTNESATFTAAVAAVPPRHYLELLLLVYHSTKEAKPVIFSTACNAVAQIQSLDSSVLRRAPVHLHASHLLSMLQHLIAYQQQLPAWLVLRMQSLLHNGDIADDSLHPPSLDWARTFCAALQHLPLYQLVPDPDVAAGSGCGSVSTDALLKLLEATLSSQEGDGEQLVAGHCRQLVFNLLDMGNLPQLDVASCGLQHVMRLYQAGHRLQDSVTQELVKEYAVELASAALAANHDDASAMFGVNAALEFALCQLQIAISSIGVDAGDWSTGIRQFSMIIRNYSTTLSELAVKAIAHEHGERTAKAALLLLTSGTNALQAEKLAQLPEGYLHTFHQHGWEEWQSRSTGVINSRKGVLLELFVWHGLPPLAAFRSCQAALYSVLVSASTLLSSGVGLEAPDVVTMLQEVSYIASNGFFSYAHAPCASILQVLAADASRRLQRDCMYMQQLLSVLKEVGNQTLSSDMQMTVLAGVSEEWQKLYEENLQDAFAEHLGQAHAVQLLLETLSKSPAVETKTMALLVLLAKNQQLCSDMRQWILQSDQAVFAAWLMPRILAPLPEVRRLSGELLVLWCWPGESPQLEVTERILATLLAFVHQSFEMDSHDASAIQELVTVALQLACSAGPVSKSLLHQVLVSLQQLLFAALSLSDYNLRSSRLLLLIRILDGFLACGALHTTSLNPPGDKDTGAASDNTHALTAGSEVVTTSTIPDLDAASEDDEEDAEIVSDCEAAGARDVFSDATDFAGSDDERALCSKTCTFTTSGSSFMEQHWYFCYTCDLTLSKGCCSVCARVCHRGHAVSYSRYSRFFCDCGAGVRGTSCMALAPRAYVPPVRDGRSSSSPGRDGGMLDNDSDSDDDAAGPKKLQPLLEQVNVYPSLQQSIKQLLVDSQLERDLLQMCLDVLQASEDLKLERNNMIAFQNLSLAADLLAESAELMSLKRSFKSGSLDLKVKVDYPLSRDLRNLTSGGQLVKACMSASHSGRIAVGEGDKVALYEAPSLSGQAATVSDKSSLKVLSRNAVRFEVVHVAFNAINDSFLAVAGMRDCQVFILSLQGEVLDRLSVELSLPDGVHIQQIAWLPGSQNHLLVVTSDSIRLYDLAADKLSPRLYLTIPGGKLRSACVVRCTGTPSVLLALADNGQLYRRILDEGTDTPMTVLEFPTRLQAGRCTSMTYSNRLQLFAAYFDDGTCVLARFNLDASSMTGCVVDFESSTQGRGEGLAFVPDTGLVAGVLRKPGGFLVFGVEQGQLSVQVLRPNGSSPAIVGSTSYVEPRSKQFCMLVVCEDGSLQVYTPVHNNSWKEVLPPSTLTASTPQHRRKLGSVQSFPVDFFESTTSITADIKLAGECLTSTTPEGAKVALASEDGFLQSPNPEGFRLSVQNHNPEMLMVGCRIAVGATSSAHIPTEFLVFNRVIRTDEGVRRWYDIPFNNQEAFSAGKEFTLVISHAHSNGMLPRIDCLEVYGRNKEEFGWRDLDTPTVPEPLEAKADGENMSPMDEVLKSALGLLQRLYIVGIVGEQERLRLAVLDGCQKRPELRPDVRALLRSLHATAEAYKLQYDAVRLRSAANGMGLLHSSIVQGGLQGSWALTEYYLQTCFITKVAAVRPKSLESFLQAHGQFCDLWCAIFFAIHPMEEIPVSIVSELVFGVVDLLHTDAKLLHRTAVEGASPKVALKPVHSSLQRLLASPLLTVRAACSLSLAPRILSIRISVPAIVSPSTAVKRARVTASPPASVEAPQSSEVQYCCDLCGICPIPDLRWHCDVCSDFDLCDRCFNQDQDQSQLQFPGEHTSLHHMTATLVSGPGATLHSIATNITEQVLLRTTSSGADYSATEAESSSLEVSASLQELWPGATVDMGVGVALGRFLAEDLERILASGCDGLQLLPYLQVLSQLCSSTQADDMLDLERITLSILSHLKSLDALPIAKRCSQGEVLILSLMFFALIMRGWRRSSSLDKVPALSTASTESTQSSEKRQRQRRQRSSSQLERTRALLRQPTLVALLRRLAEALQPMFCPPEAAYATPEDAPGLGSQTTLLVVDTEFAAGSFSPFFSDGYARAHQTDPFADYHSLLLESTFRTAYSLIRGAQGQPRDRVEPEVGLSDWKDMLCRYINHPKAASVRKYTRRLLVHACGGKPAYYSTRDEHQLADALAQLQFLQSLPMLSHEQLALLMRLLTAVLEIATARPRNWQRFCLRHTACITTLLEGVHKLPDECMLLEVKLLGLMYYTTQTDSATPPDTPEPSAPAQSSGSKDSKKRKSTKDNKQSRTSSEELEMPARALLGDSASRLTALIQDILLSRNVAAVRAEAIKFLQNLWHHSSSAEKESYALLLLNNLPHESSYGRNITDFMSLLQWVLANVLEDQLLMSKLNLRVLSTMCAILRACNSQIANHPNAPIYGTLQSLVEFEGYYLEREPCLVCNNPETPFTKLKLENIKAETKYTDRRILVKCVGSHAIQSMTMNIHDIRRSKTVRTLQLYYSNQPVADLSELRQNWSLWKRARTCHLGPAQTEFRLDFVVPFVACNIMVEFDSFYENLQAASLDTLQCPRCSRYVTDRHGICRNCHENAYQCRQCRNINYENLDSFLCNECGYSKYGRFEFCFLARPSFSLERMQSAEDMRRGLEVIEAESEHAHRRYQQLLGFKKPLVRLLASIGDSDLDPKDSMAQMVGSLPASTSLKVHRKIAILGVLYADKCKQAFDSVSKSVQVLLGARQTLMEYLNCRNVSSAAEMPTAQPASHCYGCCAAYIVPILELLGLLAKEPTCRTQLVELGVVQELFSNNLHQGPRHARTLARSVLCALTNGDGSAVTQLSHLLSEKIVYCLEHHRTMDVAASVRNEMQLLADTCSIHDEVWKLRLKLAFDLLVEAIRQGVTNPAVAEHVILPCLRIVSRSCTGTDTDADAGTTSGTADVEAPLVVHHVWLNGFTLDDVRGQEILQSSKLSHALALKYARRWRGAVRGHMELLQDNWVRELVLCECSQPIRHETAVLVDALAAQSHRRQLALLDLLTKLLPVACARGDNAAEFLDLYGRLLQTESNRLFLAAQGWLHTVSKSIANEAASLQANEQFFSTKLSQGFVLKQLIEFLMEFLKVSTIRQRFVQDGLVINALQTLVAVRGLIVQQTKLTSDCAKALTDLLKSISSASIEFQQVFVHACIAALKSFAKGDGRATSLVLEQLRSVICPTKPEAVYMLILNKTSTQEEFIRGSMTKNPYSSAEVGPLMRDVKNRICRQLDLQGLLEDDYGMELLVAGHIISLDMSVRLVFEQVWRRSPTIAHVDDPPMVVTYRLQGLDGEATEPMVDNLEDQAEAATDPEQEFQVAHAVRDCGGLEILLEMATGGNESGPQAEPLLTVLLHCCKLHANRVALLKLGALTALLEKARMAVEAQSDSAELLLLIVEVLVMEANALDVQLSSNASAPFDAAAAVRMFLEKMSSAVSKSQRQLADTVARILPFLAYNDAHAMAELVDHFVLHTDFTALDQSSPQPATAQRVQLESLVKLAESIKLDAPGGRLKQLFLQHQVTSRAVDHLLSVFPTQQDRTSQEWTEALAKPSISIVLGLLRGLAQGHEETQRLMQSSNTLALLHTLETMSSVRDIGILAENILNAVSDSAEGNILGEAVKQLRTTTRESARQRLQQQRDAVLKDLGMRREVGADGGERIVAHSPSIEGLDEIEEETELACMVCREGYSLRPTEVLGTYVFCKRVHLTSIIGESSTQVLPSPGRTEQVYTSVSHFNLIHFSCHLDAKRADASLKTPKREWEGATLRNSETLCNNLFPIRGAAVPQPQYERCMDLYWDNLSLLGRADGARLPLLVLDIAALLRRFATGASFSEDCKGGGRESNILYLPFLCQMGCHLLQQTSAVQRRTYERSLATFLSPEQAFVQSPARPAAVPLSSPTPAHSNLLIRIEDSAPYMLVLSIFVVPLSEWMRVRRSMLQKALQHAHLQHCKARGLDHAMNTTGSLSDLFEAVKPALIYTAIVDQLQQLFKAADRSRAASERASSSEPTAEDVWAIAMRERSQNMALLASRAPAILEFITELEGALDIQEALDIMGLLGDVLSSGVSSCDAFLQQALAFIG